MLFQMDNNSKLTVCKTNEYSEMLIDLNRRNNHMVLFSYFLADRAVDHCYIICKFLSDCRKARHGGLKHNEPLHEKTGLRDFGPGPTQTDLYSRRSNLEA